MFLSYLNYFAGCPGRGDVISTWICMCLLHNWTAEGMLAWDWWSSGIMRKASLFVGLPGHRGLTLWVWPMLGECIVHHFPTSLSFSCTVTHQRGGKKVAFHWWNMHRNPVKSRVSQLATTAFHDLEPFPSNLNEYYRVTHYFHHQHEGSIWVHSMMAGLLLWCNLLGSDFKVLREWDRSCTGSGLNIYSYRNVNGFVTCSKSNHLWWMWSYNY